MDGRIATSGRWLYRVRGFRQTHTLYVHARVASGYLDSLVALLKPSVDPAELAREPLDALVKFLSRDHDPIEPTRRLLDRHALACRQLAGPALDRRLSAHGRDCWALIGARRRNSRHQRLL
jgi:hypothetical protein